MDHRSLAGAAFIAGACIMLAVLLCGDTPYTVFTVLIPLGFLGCAAVVLRPLVTLDVRAWIEGVATGFALPLFCLVPVRLVASTDRVQDIVLSEIVAISTLSIVAIIARVRLGRRALRYPDLIPAQCPGAARWETNGVQWAIRGGGATTMKGGARLWVTLQSAVVAPRRVWIHLEDVAGAWDERGTVAWTEPESILLPSGAAVEVEISLVPGAKSAPESQVYVRVGAVGEDAERTMGDPGREPSARVTALSLGAALLTGGLALENSPNVTFKNDGRRVASGPPPAPRLTVLRGGASDVSAAGVRDAEGARRVAASREPDLNPDAASGAAEADERNAM